MERKHEEQVRQTKELQGHAGRLQWKNDQLRAHMEKSRDLRKDVRDGGRAVHPITRNKVKEPVIPDNVDTLVDDKMPSGSSSSLSLSPTKNARESTKAKLRKSPSHHLAFSDAISGASRRVRRETNRRQNQLVQALRNTSVFPEGEMPLVLFVGTMPPMPLVPPAFDKGPTFHIPPVALI